MRMMLRAETLKEKALDLGFNFAGVIPAAPAPTLDAYFRWIEAGMHGKMGYLARPDRQARRRDLNVILPGVRSMLLVGLDYRALPVAEEILNDPARGRIASYAWGLDYHDLMSTRLEELAAWLQYESAGQFVHRVYVDTGAILERAHAQRAGMGFTGKNTMLIHPRQGSYFFLGEILIDAEFDRYDTPAQASMCGTCTRCLVACPTDAFPRPFVLDARRCISYLTIEDKGWIERELRPLLGNWVFGCDVCQDVCPWQRFALPSAEAAFYPGDIDRAAPPLLSLLALNDDAFRARYRGTPLYRIKRARLVRNACVAAGNWGSPDALPALRALLHDDSPLVRGHAAWALHRIAGDDVCPTLRAHYQREIDPDVRGEIDALLQRG
jgi:epoxyqueuosine reductase